MKLKFCPADELEEGGVKSVKVLARTIAVFKVKGELFALEADCKHMKASIAQGELNGTVITCPAHGWQYDITTGQCLNEPWAKLKSFPVEIEQGIIVVELP